MRNIYTASLILISTMALSACGGYETLRTTFDFRGDKNIDYVGAESTQTKGVVNPNSLNRNNSNLNVSSNAAPGAPAYEVSVNAPIGSVMNDAIVLFHKEANKLCLGKGYRHKITQKTTKDHVQYLRTDTFTQQIPTAKGVVICDS